MPKELIKNAIIKNSCRVKKNSTIVFVCGRDINAVGSKRKIFIDYAKKHIQAYTFLLAEDFFKIKGSTSSNMLEDEHRLARYSDCVLIILESESAFAELGAFASSKELQRILIIINDKKHKTSPSFITKGIIKPLEAIAGDDSVCVYADWEAVAGSFGDVSNKLAALSSKQSKPLSITNRSDLLREDKLRMLLVHDLVSLLAPITKNEILEVLKSIFGTGRYDSIHIDVQLLQAVKLLERIDDFYFASHPGERFLTFPGDNTYAIRSACIMAYKKCCPERLKMLARFANGK